MNIVKLSSAQFEKFANNHKYRNYYQTKEYAAVMTNFGYKTQFLGAVNNENKLIGASLIIYKEVFMGYKIAYAPRGILFNYEDSENIINFTKKLKKTLKKQQIILLKIDPYIPITIRDYEGKIINSNTNTHTIEKNLKKAGFTYKGKTLFFETEKPRWEAIVLLQKNIDEISAKLDKRTRNKIRKATNSGIEIVKDQNKNINKIYSFVKNKDKNSLIYYKNIIDKFQDNIDVYHIIINTETFLINSRRNYEKETEYNYTLAEKIQNIDLTPKERDVYISKKMESDRIITSYKNNLIKATELLKDNPNGIIIGGAIVIKYDNAAYLILEGTDEKYSNLNSNYLLKWKMINDYNDAGIKYLNLNAINGDFEHQNEFSGLNESKLGFNSTITEYIGEFEIIISPFIYNLYKKLNKKEKKK